MFELSNATGSIPLFTADGGPGQKRWYSIRVNVSDVGTDGWATLYVNSNPTSLSVPVSSGNSVSRSDHFLLTTGDEVTLELGSAEADIVVGMSVDEDDLSNPPEEEEEEVLERRSVQSHAGMDGNWDGDDGVDGLEGPAGK